MRRRREVHVRLESDPALRWESLLMLWLLRALDVTRRVATTRAVCVALCRDPADQAQLENVRQVLRGLEARGLVLPAPGTRSRGQVGRTPMVWSLTVDGHVELAVERLTALSGPPHRQRREGACALAHMCARGVAETH